MLDPDKLHFTSEHYRGLLDIIGEEIDREDMAERAGDSITASKHGLKVWGYLLKLMEMLKADSIYELDQGHVTIYDLLYWATSFSDELHNAKLKDKSFEKHKLNFCQSYVEMHRGMLDREVRNLGNIRTSLAECYYQMGKTEKVDSLYSEWLSAEPDWGWGWIGWSDLYWFWNIGFEKDFKKAESILKEGFSTPHVRDREHIKQRLVDLEKLRPTNQCT